MQRTHRVTPAHAPEFGVTEDTDQARLGQPGRSMKESNNKGGRRRNSRRLNGNTRRNALRLRLDDAGASTRERQPAGEDGVDDRLRVEVDRAQADKRNVDEVGQRPETVEEDHQQEDVAGAVW